MIVGGKLTSDSHVESPLRHRYASERSSTLDYFGSEEYRLVRRNAGRIR